MNRSFKTQSKTENSNKFNLMNSKEFKKLTDQNKSKLNAIAHNLKTKEAEKAAKKRELDLINAEMQNAKDKTEELKILRKEITDEVKRLTEELKINVIAFLFYFKQISRESLIREKKTILDFK